ncbi:hypothetical protein LEN26_018822 [Aphanomyces euteiches]|nr:hypothetical protein LEN26_018822 [Aphanomyces euteiches]KAH9126459.1 hypothetical protein AeMF1_003111 [Aphanomyces euteiches]KAH9187694.1 hypothetical protein AeNC1_010327 [Aphanomyces euteiches]
MSMPLSFIIAFAILVIIPFLVSRFCSYRNRHNDPLLPNESVGHLAGLTRDKLENISLEATKWTCGICDFHNPEERATCELCDTPQATFLLEDPAFESMEGTIPPEQLNLKQWSARYRNQWQRRLEGQEWHWFAQMPPKQGTTYYITAVDSEAERLLLQPLSSLSAGTLVWGHPLPIWWFYQLQELQALPFSLKYAWLLAQLAETYQSHARLTVRREEIFERSIEALNNASASLVCSLTMITFQGESAVDAGGVTREWYTLLTYSIFDPKEGLFVANKADQSFFINANSEHDHGPKHLEKYHAIGRLLGRAIVDEQVLPFQFSTPLFKMILGYPVSMDDIRYLDETVYTSLEYVRDTDDVDVLALTFSVSLDATTEVDLIPNGRNIEVTNANKTEYVERMVHYLLFDSVAPQLQQLVHGLYEVLPQELLMIFDYKELELVLCGFSEIDVADWKRCTNVSMSLESIVDWFWEIVENEMTSVQREKLLQFVTGSSRVPLQGFKGLTSHDGQLCPFSLHGVPYEKGAFPKVHSCFNRIDLPIYPTRELLHEGLFMLVNIECMAFTMV